MFLVKSLPDEERIEAAKNRPRCRTTCQGGKKDIVKMSLPSIAPKPPKKGVGQARSKTESTGAN